MFWNELFFEGNSVTPSRYLYLNGKEKALILTQKVFPLQTLFQSTDVHLFIARLAALNW